MTLLKLPLFLATSLLFACGAATAQPLAITNVTVIDVAEGSAVPAMTVVVTGDRIAAVGEADAVEVPADATVIDAEGQYLIPGLWDMHTHSGADDLTRTIVLPLYVAHGVTGVREMSGSPGQLRLRAKIAEGRLLGPRMVVGSPFVDGPNPWPGGERFALRTPELRGEWSTRYERRATTSSRRTSSCPRRPTAPCTNAPGKSGWRCPGRSQ